MQKHHPEDPSPAGQVAMALGWVGLQGPRAESSPRPRGSVRPAHEEGTELHGSGWTASPSEDMGEAAPSSSCPPTTWVPGLTRPAPGP